MPRKNSWVLPPAGHEVGYAPIGQAITHARGSVRLPGAASIHDVGKVAIPDAILQKPAALDEAEWRVMRTHTVIGERILGAAPALSQAAKIVRSSHERFDGGGYPDGLVGDEIPLGASIIAVCDAYDAMRSDRPYRKASSMEGAVSELRRNAGTQFHPDVVDAFVAAVAKEQSIALGRDMKVACEHEAITA
jgi:HD-GYP domain-containing protein (c-di-GMP phosphodiesterase class II)